MNPTVNIIVKEAFLTFPGSPIIHYNRHGVIEVEQNPDKYNWMKVEDHKMEINKLREYIKQAVQRQISLQQLNNYTVKI